MTMEFKASIPSCDDYLDRTVGLYSDSRLLTDPYGRHNVRRFGQLRLKLVKAKLWKGGGTSNTALPSLTSCG
ncbi:hypothetical protein BDN67DRAFT_964482 [Paxillus ammoniavirescens]|nr:hypothetical protein BDN67DRAFT_964482 [Paxillus ammoniavirescens]